MKIYGIKTCGSVKKAMGFFEARGIAYEWIDFKQQKPTLSDLERWLKQSPIDRLFNAKSATYRALGLKELNLDEAGKKEWLLKDFRLIKRPVVELDNGAILVGFDESEYERIVNG